MLVQRFEPQVGALQISIIIIINRKSRTRASYTGLVLAFTRRRSNKHPSVLQRIVMPSLVLASAANSITANSRLKRIGARRQPCFTSFMTGNGSDTSPFSMTLAIMPSCKDRTKLVNLVRAAEFRQDGPAARSAEGVECLSEVYEQEVQVLALLQAFLHS